MKTILAAAISIWLSLATGALAQGGAASIQVSGGRIAEAQASSGGLRVYKGLPYAAAPVGALRWREPQPVTPWRGVRPTSGYGANCLQPWRYADIDPFQPGMSEDCLFLNVWTAAKPGERRPVFFWIHGGGYGAGSGSEPRHDGAVLAAKGVVVVTINYRLGPFGFLAHPALTAESPHHGSGDYALMDMVAALRWVQANIAAFGGDPSRVTIAGESAGSEAVSRMMASPLAKGLFSQAIGESGSGFSRDPDGETQAAGEKVGLDFAAALHAPDLASLRAKSSAEILAMWSRPDRNFPFHPVVDGYAQVATVREVFARGSQNDTPLLVGWNRDEGALFAGMFGGRTLSQALANTFKDRAAQAARFYPSGTPAEEKASRARLAGDLVMNLPTWEWAAAQSRTGHAPVWVYRFDHPPPIPADWFGGGITPEDAGAFHSAEITYVFGHPDSYGSWRPTEADRRLADVMSTAWANFSAKGDPNGPGLAPWPRYDPGASPPVRMVFDVESRPAPDDDLDRRRLLVASQSR